MGNLDNNLGILFSKMEQHKAKEVMYTCQLFCRCILNFKLDPI